MKQNLRTLLDIKDGYYKINREERNLAAIFYHTLLVDDNLEKFLHVIGCKFPIVEKEMGIYFEYAFIRDLWSNIKEGNEFKRKIIIELLQPTNRQFLENCTICEFNTYFGAVPKPSITDIQSPGNWSIVKYHKTIIDNDEFIKVCKFKWCFNAKPDIVIHTSHDTAICIEAKFISLEGQYPNNEIEKKIFNERGIPFVGQLSIQKEIMELLGISTQFIFLVQKKSSTSFRNEYIFELTWKEAFTNLTTENCSHFIKEWINRPDINQTELI